MSKTEKVRIELPTKAAAPPAKPCRVRNQKPVTNKFKLIPKYMPFLSQFVENVSWNCSANTINIELTETPRFDSYNWFSTINKRLSDSQKSSFVDLEQDSLLLVLMDECEKEVSTIKFRGLSLVEHNCYLTKRSFGGIDAPAEPLTHIIVIRYADSETLEAFHNDDDDCMNRSPEKKNEVVDEEWQAIE